MSRLNNLRGPEGKFMNFLLTGGILIGIVVGFWWLRRNPQNNNPIETPIPTSTSIVDITITPNATRIINIPTPRATTGGFVAGSNEGLNGTVNLGTNNFWNKKLQYLGQADICGFDNVNEGALIFNSQDDSKVTSLVPDQLRGSCIGFSLNSVGVPGQVVIMQDNRREILDVCGSEIPHEYIGRKLKSGLFANGVLVYKQNDGHAFSENTPVTLLLNKPMANGLYIDLGTLLIQTGNGFPIINNNNPSVLIGEYVKARKYASENRLGFFKSCVYSFNDRGSIIAFGADKDHLTKIEQ